MRGGETYIATVCLNFIGVTPPSWRGFARCSLERRLSDDIELRMWPYPDMGDGVAVMVQRRDAQRSPRDCATHRAGILSILADAFDLWTNTTLHTRASAQSLIQTHKKNG